MNMDQMFQQQMLGLMQMANMFMGASEIDRDMYENEGAYTQSPFYDDRAPIPRQEQPSPVEPTFVAPHQSYYNKRLIYRNVSTNQAKQTQRTSILFMA
jgi:hypothetical protein